MIDRLSMPTLVLGLAVTSLFAWSLVQGSPVGGGPLMAVLAVATIGLEVSASPIPRFGFFRAAPAAILAAALTPGLGVAPASVLSLTGLLLRTLLRGRPEAVARLKEALVDAAADLGALTLLGLLAEKGAAAAALAAALSWVALSFMVPGVLAAELSAEENQEWGAARDVVLLPLLGVGLLGPGLAVLVSSAPWQGLWLIPALAALQRLVGHLAASPRRREQKEALYGLRRARQAEEQALVALEASRLEAHRKATELGALEEMTRILARSESFQEALEATVRLVAGMVPCDSVAVFLPVEGRLLPKSFVSPHAERLEGALLLDVTEPAVEQAWARGATVDAAEPVSGERLLPGEATYVAGLLRGVGVLYVGRADPEDFSEDERHLLGVLAAQASVALEAARRKEGERSALELHRRAHHHLHHWVERLTSLLDGIRAMASTLDPAVLGERLERAVGAVIPHEYGWLVAPGEHGTRTWPATAAFDRPAAGALVDTVRTNRAPLLLEEMGASRFRPPVEGCRSLLAAPVPDEGAAWGAVVLGARPARAFDREHQDLLLLVAFLAAVCYSSCGRHQGLAQAHTLLKESQAKLVHASKLAAIGQLAAGIAHELNTPLAAIMLSLDAAELQLKRRPERAAERLEQARAAIEQARDIISRLLIYTREGFTGQWAELNQVAEGALALVRKELERDGVELVVELSSQDALIEGSAAELQQVVTSLLANARDAVLREGSPSRRVTLRTRKDEQGRAVLEVEDGGSGVSPEVRERVFEPFFTTKPVGQGMGLGLAISHQVVTQHGGSLELADAELDRGALFRVLLPVAG